MKILIHSQYADSIGLAHHLKMEGHSVKVFIEEENLRDSGLGIVDHVSSMADGIREKPDFVIFDFTKTGKMADELRLSGIPVWCGAEFADDLERDRKFGTDFMRQCGIRIPETNEFKSVDEAISHIKSKPDVYVVKMDGDCSSASSYVSKSDKDMIEHLEYLKEQGEIKKGTIFILQKKINGIEISTEVLFSNGKPIEPFNHTFETKKFLPGDLGPNTGCETSVIIPITGKSKMMEKTLYKCFKELEKRKYTGHFDLNCIVSEKDHEPYGLEWTPRCGYSSMYATLAMMSGNLGEMLYKLASGTIKYLPMVHKFGTAIRMTIPPYPNEDFPDIFETVEGQWVKFPKDMKNVWPVNVKKDKKDRYLTSGFYGLVAELTGQGNSIESAWKISQKNFDDTHVANKQGRYIDGIDSAKKRIKTLKQWGYEMPEVN